MSFEDHDRFMKILLTDEEKQDLLYQHSLTRDGRIRDRIKVVIHSSNNWSPTEIADALLIHETTVRQHIKDFQLNRKLKPENGGSSGYLSKAQSAELIAHLETMTYSTTKQIISYIIEQFSVTYTVPGLNKWLHQHGFSYKKTKGLPHKVNLQEQAHFAGEYKKLKALVGADNIYFMDAVHPTQATKMSCGWIKKGTNKLINTTGSRTRLNIIGALSLSDISSTKSAMYDTINSENVCRFFFKLRENDDLNKPIHLILDGAGYHRSQLVKDIAQVLNIQLHYLPPYSPNLNPIERLWKVMNEHVRNNVYFKTARCFKEAMTHFFSVKLPEIGDSLASRINDNFQLFDEVPSS